MLTRKDTDISVTVISVTRLIWEWFKKHKKTNKKKTKKKQKTKKKKHFIIGSNCIIQNETIIFAR